MATWRYIKGSEEDFEGALEWATLVVTGGEFTNKWYLESFEEGKTKHSRCDDVGIIWNVLDYHHGAYNILAQRERVTSVNDDRLVQALIAERGSRYGKFADGAEIMRDLKHVMHKVDGWNNLTASQKEALDMIQHKIGRILNGDPTYDDNWKDIAGYATLIVEELNGVKK
jgi:hypothetical protein